ncbi:DUF4399 domain-containing protein [bacterium]|jgi:hypothetical protein|nr:DUF4399 domain-containing protein [bacterium]
MKKLATLSALVLLLTSASIFAEDTEKKVFFVSPKDGATVSQKFKVKFGVKGYKISPAGQAIEDPSSGHHHLIVDGGPINKGDVVPTDDNHIHFGKGQTDTKLFLKPGKHKLTMQFADGAHRSYGEAASATITVTVK